MAARRQARQTDGYGDRAPTRMDVLRLHHLTPLGLECLCTRVVAPRFHRGGTPDRDGSGEMLPWTGRAGAGRGWTRAGGSPAAHRAAPAPPPAEKPPPVLTAGPPCCVRSSWVVLS